MKARRRLLRPVCSALGLLARKRLPARDLGLATILAAIAAAANTGGFFALGHYTSHMTGDATLRILLLLGLCFLLGGIIGAVGCSQIGFFLSLPPALILLAPSFLRLVACGPSAD